MKPRPPMELTGLAKTFPGATAPVTVLTDVNATIATGEFVAILGHSGCGKSTLLSIIAGLETATSGGVAILPSSIFAEVSRSWRSIQANTLW